MSPLGNQCGLVSEIVYHLSWSLLWKMINSEETDYLSSCALCHGRYHLILGIAMLDNGSTLEDLSEYCQGLQSYMISLEKRAR